VIYANRVFGKLNKCGKYSINILQFYIHLSSSATLRSDNSAAIFRIYTLEN